VCVDGEVVEETELEAASGLGFWELDDFRAVGTRYTQLDIIGFLQRGWIEN
jgi:hypothetical protein